MGEVLIEVDTIIYIVRRHLIPHACQYLQTTANHQNSTVDKFSKRIKDSLEHVISAVNKLEESKKSKADSLSGCQELRLEVMQVSQ
jgi:glutamine synthetase type III